MRILLAVHGYPPTHTAGAERQTERLAHWLLARGHDVEVFALEALHAAGCRVESGPHDDVLVHRVYFDVDEAESTFRGSYDHPRIGEAFQVVLSSRPRFDVVHVVSGYWIGNQVIRTAGAHGVPVVISLMEYWFLCPQLNLIQPTGALCSGPDSDRKCARCVLEGMRRYRLPAKFAPGLTNGLWHVIGKLPAVRRVEQQVRRRRETLRDALTHVDRAICNSRFIIEVFSAAGFDTGRFKHIRQGLPQKRVMPRSARSAVRDVLRLGYLGQLKFHKGVDLVVEAVAQLSRSGHSVTLDIWGSETEDPHYVTTLKARFPGLPAIRWNGSYGGSHAVEVLDALDAVVVPSRWYENSPNVILEAYDMGLPVVATRLGGMAELVQHERTGLLFSLNDVDDLRTQLERLATQRGLYEELCANIPTVRTVDEEGKDLMRIYGQAARSKGTDAVKAGTP